MAPFLAGHLDPQHRMVCVNAPLGLFTEVLGIPSSATMLAYLLLRVQYYLSTVLIAMAFPFTDSS